MLTMYGSELVKPFKSGERFLLRRDALFRLISARMLRKEAGAYQRNHLWAH